MAYCLRFLDSHNEDVQALRQDIELRGYLGVPMPLSLEAVKEFENGAREAILDSVLVMTLALLHDICGFGKKRLSNFKERFNEAAEMMAQDRLAWVDLQAGLKEQCGIEVPIRWYGGPPKQTPMAEWGEEQEEEVDAP